jgi:hypothetical protein
MNIKRFSQVSENFEPTNELVTKVDANIYGLPSDVEVDGCVAHIFWNVRFRVRKDHFSFDIWVSKVILECVWKILDIEGEVLSEEDKTFEYDSESIRGSQPDNDQLQYTIRPESFDVTIKKDQKHDVEIYWS